MTNNVYSFYINPRIIIIIICVSNSKKKLSLIEFITIVYRVYFVKKVYMYNKTMDIDGRNKIIVKSGEYTFQIIDNTLFSRDKTEIYSRNFKIGGNYPDCVNVSIIYKNNKPYDAIMPNLLSDTECSFDKPLEKGGGSIIMIKTLLQYVYSQIPTLTHIRFDDKSNIECATEKGTYVKPMPLYYFSILFNGQTWYEKHFDAKQKDEGRHQEYRKRVDEFLHSQEYKKNISFGRFVSLFDKREEEMPELYKYYNDANTFHAFFQSIPKKDRCRLVGTWIEPVMKIILKDVFYNDNWYIPFPLKMNGGRHKKTRKYYCPKGVIRNNFIKKNICISQEDL